jgi:hypothetical protein
MVDMLIVAGVIGLFVGSVAVAVRLSGVGRHGNCNSQSKRPYSDTGDPGWSFFDAGFSSNVDTSSSSVDCGTSSSCDSGGSCGDGGGGSC